MKLIDFGIGPIRNEIVHIQGGLLVLPHCLPPNTIAFLAEFVPNSFKNQSNDEISIEKLHSTLFRNKRFLVNLILQRYDSNFALFMEKENPHSFFLDTKIALSQNFCTYFRQLLTQCICSDERRRHSYFQIFATLQSLLCMQQMSYYIREQTFDF